MTKLLTDKPINEFPNRQGIDAGDFISSADMNACLDAMGERTNYLYTMGIYPHNTAFAYPIGAFCQVSGVVYRAAVANTGKPPVSNPSIWTACPMTAAEISAALNFVTALNGKQDADNTLTALANLATSADKMIYATGADQFALTPLTAFIRTLLDDGDAAAARVTLGAAPLASPSLTGAPTAPTAAAGTNTTQLATTAFVQTGLSSRLNKSGDIVTGLLKAQYTNDWVGFAADNPTEGKSAFFDGRVAGVPRGGMHIKPAAGGNGEYFTAITVTPAGATNADRRVGGLDVYAGGLYAYAYGWLHDYFLKRSDCITNWYPSHYGGAQTFKIRHLNLMITTMYVPGLGADTTLNLPEAYTGVAHAFATDAGGGKNALGIGVVSGTKVRVYAGPSTNTNILLIGYKDNI